MSSRRLVSHLLSQRCVLRRHTGADQWLAGVMTARAAAPQALSAPRHCRGHSSPPLSALFALTHSTLMQTQFIALSSIDLAELIAVDGSSTSIWSVPIVSFPCLHN